jgi:hypothetical protein
MQGMHGNYWERLKQVFEQVLERPQEERFRFLAEACGGDESLRKEVQGLLEGLQGHSDFLRRSGDDGNTLPRGVTPLTTVPAPGGQFGP